MSNFTEGQQVGPVEWKKVLAGTGEIFSVIGLNDLAQSHIHSARMFSDTFTVFDTEPRNDLLSDRDSNEAYCLAAPGSKYAVYFPDGGNVRLDVVEKITGADGWSIQWLDIPASRWLDPEFGSMDGNAMNLTTPGTGHWVAVLFPQWDD